MSKDPAFLFYSNNFLSGTMLMTNEQVGKYIRLLIAQHQNGHLTENHMILICNGYDADVFAKFKKDAEGLYYNERLDKEVDRRKTYCESRGKNKRGRVKRDILENDMKIISKSHENHTSIFNIQESIINKEGVQGENSFCLSIEETKLRISEMPSWKEGVQRTYKLSSDQVEKYLTDFFAEMTLKGECSRSIQQTKSHFINWLKIQLKNNHTGKDQPCSSHKRPDYKQLSKENAERIKG